MTQIARRWPVVTAVVATAVASVVGFGGGTASADPASPTPAPQPSPLAPDVLAQHTPANPSALPPANPSALPPGTTPADPSVPLTTAPTMAALVPATSDTLRQFLESKGVELQAQQPTGFNALDITLPVPTGWTQVPDPNVPDAFVVIANRVSDSLYTSNAQLVVYKLVGEFDAREAITHGNIEAQQLPAWRTTDQLLTGHEGFPSSRIEGTFRQNEMTLNTSRRDIIATSGTDRYLVSMAVTTAANLAVSDAAATDAIVTGFTVAAPGSTAKPAVPTPAVVAPPAVTAPPAVAPPAASVPLAAAPAASAPAASAPVMLHAQPQPPGPAPTSTR